MKYRSESADIHSIHYRDFFDLLNEAYKGTRATDSSLIPTMQIKMIKE